MSTEWPGEERRRVRTDLLNKVSEDTDSKKNAQETPAETTRPADDGKESDSTYETHKAPLVTGSLSSAITGADSLETPLPAEEGWQRKVRAWTFGMITPKPGPEELARRSAIASIRRVYPRPVVASVLQPGGGIGKTCGTVALASTIGNISDHVVLALDNNETMGTLGVRTRSNGSTLTVIDLLEALHELKSERTRSGDVQYFTRPQGDNRFSVLASDEDPGRMQMVTREIFNELLEVVQRFWNVVVLDTGNNTRAENWLAGIEITDQAIFPVELNDKSVVSVLRAVEQLQAMSEQTGNDHYANLCRNAVVVISPGSHKRSVSPERRKELRGMLEQALGENAKFLSIPYEPELDTNGVIDWQLASEQSVRAWEKVAAAVSEGMYRSAVTSDPRKQTNKES